MDLRRTPRLALAAMVLTVLATWGCSDATPPGGTAKPHAAEPGRAPAMTAEPAGASLQLGPQPQGVVFDPRTNLLAVVVREPERLLLVDPKTAEVRRTVRLPGKARHLQLAQPGGPVLVPSESADQLVQVPLPHGHVRTTDTAAHPHDATRAGNGDLVVADEFGGAVSVIRDGQVVRTFRDLDQPGGVVADGDWALVVDVGAFALSRYDLDTMRRTARVDAGAGPTHVVALDHHRVVVTDTRGGRLLEFATDPLHRTGSLRLPGNPYGVAVDPRTDTVWVTLTLRNQVVGVDYSGRRPRVVDRYPTVRQPDTVAVAPGGHTLWVTGTRDGVLQRITR